MVDRFGMVASTSRRGNCYVMALMSRVCELLKNELLLHCKFKILTVEIEVIAELIEFITGVNEVAIPRRRHC